jgi:hypothetical protein
MSDNFQPTNPWLKTHSKEIKTNIQNLVKNSNFFIDINDSIVFNIIKGNDLSKKIKDNLESVVDSDNILFGVLPDLVLDSSIIVTSSDTPNHNFYYDKANFMLYINIYDKTASELIVNAQSFTPFFLNPNGNSSERLKFIYKILNFSN